MSDLKRKFLKPVSVLVAALLSSTLQTSKANASMLNAATENALKVTPVELEEGRPSPDRITLEPAYAHENEKNHYSHRSHSSHKSHSSHRSHSSGL